MGVSRQAKSKRGGVRRTAKQAEIGMKDFILRTKLQRPPPAPDILPRVRLLDRLNEGRHRPLTLNSAPAGYGKTTLAVQWLERCPSKVAWICLDKDDSDPDRFSRYLVASIQAAMPECLLHDFLMACGIIGGSQALNRTTISYHI